MSICSALNLKNNLIIHDVAKLNYDIKIIDRFSEILIWNFFLLGDVHSYIYLFGDKICSVILLIYVVCFSLCCLQQLAWLNLVSNSQNNISCSLYFVHAYVLPCFMLNHYD